jgi:hydroxymethylbilane synthase
VIPANRTLRVGTRPSALARAQSGLVAAGLERVLLRPVALVHVSTHGDESGAPISTFGTTGVFTSAVREALLNGEIDCAVHSYKDLPTAPYPGLTLAAVPEREDPRDVLISRDRLTLGELPMGSRVGTGAPRRVAQLRALGLGLEFVPVRGNIDTRIGKVYDGELDGVVLARAGVARLARMAEVSETLDPIQVLPAPAQGALAVECRTGDDDVEKLLSGLDDPYTRAAVAAERSLLATLEAGCSAPVAALGEVVEGEDGMEIFLRGSVTALDGSDGVRLSATGPIAQAVEVGQRLARDLLDVGAAELMGRS